MSTVLDFVFAVVALITIGWLSKRAFDKWVYKPTFGRAEE